MSARHRIAVTWLLSSATALAEPRAPRAPHAPAPDDERVTPALLALRDELAGIATDGEVAAKAAHFRPLCDADGYPLVGNIVTKGSGPKQRPSKFCATVRAKKSAT